MYAMHLGFDISQTGQGKAGCGFFAHAFARELIASDQIQRISLYPTFGDFFHDANMPRLNPYPGRGVAYHKAQKTVAEAKHFWRAENLEVRLGKPDLIHSNNFWCPPRLSSTRLVYTLHDLAFAEHPEWSTENNRIGCFKGVFWASTAADWIVANSHSTRNHFLRVFPHYPEDRIEVIYPGSRYPDSNVQGSRPNLHSNVDTNAFWLSVGTIEPRKNQIGLARAYAAYRETSTHPLPLVFAGGNGWLMASFKQTLEELGILDHVIFMGYVTDDELIWLYKNCFASIYPSHFEGFGFPVLEALQFGAASITSNTTSLPEVAGKASLSISPENVEGITEAMRLLERDPALRKQLQVAGPLQAARFDWASSTTRLIALYLKVLESPRL